MSVLPFCLQTVRPLLGRRWTLVEQGLGCQRRRFRRVVRRCGENRKVFNLRKTRNMPIQYVNEGRERFTAVCHWRAGSDSYAAHQGLWLSVRTDSSQAKVPDVAGGRRVADAQYGLSEVNGLVEPIGQQEPGIQAIIEICRPYHVDR